jgi:steroid 5-alpha reductase family enzyme
MVFAHAFAWSVVVVVAAKTAAWAWQLRSRNAGMVDAIWAWTLGSLALLYAAAGSAPGSLRLLLAAMGGVWGLRLGAHLWRRNHGKPEDWRYARLRSQWGARADRNMFWFFQFQNLFTLLLSAAAFAPVAYRTDLPALPWLLLAAALWLGSIIGEGIADRQMERFRADPANKGRVCRDGLWRYSRHPNYFFECLHWVAYVPLALGAPWGAVSLLAPAVMAVLLLKLSGVPMLEAEMAQRKPGYAAYMRTTSMLIPWWPREAGTRGS